MVFPSDIVLPNSARYYTFLETKKRYNSNYDIVWSFQYKLPAIKARTGARAYSHTRTGARVHGRTRVHGLAGRLQGFSK